VDFCTGHFSSPLQETSQTLPTWAAIMLGHIAGKAWRRQRFAAEVDLESLLSLLRLLRQFRVLPAPDERFFDWASSQLSLHGSRESDPGLMAAAVAELVPLLPVKDRYRLANALLKGRAAQMLGGPRNPETWQTGGSGATTTRSDAASQPPSSASTKLLHSSPEQPEEDELPLLQLRRPVFPRAEVSRLQRAKVDESPRSSTQDSKAGLWGCLSSDRPASGQRSPRAAPAEVVQEAPRAAPALVAQAVHQRSHKVYDEAINQVADASSPAQDEREERRQEEESGEIKVMRSKLELAMARLEQLEAKLAEKQQGEQESVKHALNRVEALETRFEDHEQRQVEQDFEKKRVEQRQATASSTREGGGSMDRVGGIGGGLAPAWPESPGGDGGKALEIDAAVSPTDSEGPPVSMHLHRPFVFEEFRRANSARLQMERQRVLVPPDHFPMWPIPRK